MAASADDSRPPGDDPEDAVVLDGARRRKPEVSDGARGRDDEDPGRSLWRGLISLVILVALVVSLLLAVPGLHGVADAVADMRLGWVAVAVVFEILSCLGYVIAFLQVFDRAPIRFGARVALSELAFGAAVSVGGAGSIAVGAWLLVERGANPARVAQRSAVLFLLTSAINVVTLVLAGLGLALGLLNGPDNPLLSVVPAAVGTAVLALFLALPAISDRVSAGWSPGRARTLLTEFAGTIRSTRQLLSTPGLGGIIGAIAFPAVVRHRGAGGVLRRGGNGSAGRDDRARLPDRLPVQSDPRPREHRRSGREPRGDVRHLWSVGDARHRGDGRLSRHRPVGPGNVGHGAASHHSAAHAPRADHPAGPTRDPAAPAHRAPPASRGLNSGGRIPHSSVAVDRSARRPYPGPSKGSGVGAAIP